MSSITPDYYETLELKRDTNQEEIREAFRNLSLKYHPSKATLSKKAMFEYQFHRIAEAYEVLSDRKHPHYYLFYIANKKGIYDIYGKEGLYNGIRDKEGNIKGAYKYTGNSQEIFLNFMNTVNPFALIRDNDQMTDDWGSIFSSAYGGQSQEVPTPLPNIIAECECSLEEFYSGCIKKLTYKRNALNLDKRTTSYQENTIDIEIFPGHDKTTVLTYQGQGNEAPGMKSSDLIVHLCEKPHPLYKRVNNDDLVYVETITLIQALNSSPIHLTTLDGRKLMISMDEIISPKSVKCVTGEGMPIYNRKAPIENLVFNEKKGNLYIKFKIIFPDYIKAKTKEEISLLLTSN